LSGIVNMALALLKKVNACAITQAFMWRMT
jgi:hypothetical protein